jgi:DNA-binding NarL/FixJ family response regulator
VLQGLGRGLRSAEIGEALSISKVTVRNHVSKILIKLQVHSKLAAVVFAYQHNMIGRPAPV